MVEIIKGADGLYHLDFSKMDISNDYEVCDYVDPNYPDIIQIRVMRKHDKIVISRCFSVFELEHILADKGHYLEYCIHNMIQIMPSEEEAAINKRRWSI